VAHTHARAGTESEAEALGKPSVTIGRYKISKTLGHGSFGKVKLARHTRTFINVAIKIINRSKIKTTEMSEKVKREISILSVLRHSHIIRLYEVIETPTEIFLVMEFVSGGELFDYIVTRGKLHEEEARRLFQQVISALAFCHHHGIVHRDLKPENLLISADGAIKLADFGLANFVQDGEFLRTSCGSPNYAAPEVIMGNLYAGPEVDMWSAGVILYALLCGSLPFDDDVIFKLFKKIKAGTYPVPSFLSEDSRALISRLLCVDPLNRITMPEVRRHSWFKYRLPNYLAVAPAALEASQKRSQQELDEDAIDDMLRLETFAPLASHRALVRQWLLRAAASASAAAVPGAPAKLEEERKMDKMLQGLRVAYELILDVRVNRSNIAQHRAMADANLRAARPPPAFSPKTAPGMLVASGAKPAAEEPAATRRSWYLGIQSKKDPAHVMAEVFRSLRSLRCQWNVVSPYRLLCRWRPTCSGLNDVPNADVWVYAGLQVYKIQSRVYLLDFQRIGSHSCALNWMMLCTLVINSLKPPSSSTSSAVVTATTTAATATAATASSAGASQAVGRPA